MNIVSGGDPGYIALKRLLRRLFPGKGNSYADKVRSIFGSNLVGYWQLNEPSGTVAKDYSATGANGIYGAAVTLAAAAGPGASMGRAPSFPGATNGNVTFAAGALTALNGAWSPDEFTISVWFKMDTIAHWNDANGYVVASIGADANNRYLLYKSGANIFTFRSSRNGVVTQQDHIATTELGWINVTGIASKSANQFAMYWQGSQVGVTQALGGAAIVGALSATSTAIGAVGTLFWPGDIDHVVLAKVAATPAQVAQLAVAA